PSGRPCSGERNLSDTLINNTRNAAELLATAPKISVIRCPNTGKNNNPAPSVPATAPAVLTANKYATPPLSPSLLCAVSEPKGIVSPMRKQGTSRVATDRKANRVVEDSPVPAAHL